MKSPLLNLLFAYAGYKLLGAVTIVSVWHRSFETSPALHLLVDFALWVASYLSVWFVFSVIHRRRKNGIHDQRRKKETEKVTWVDS